MTEKLKGQRMGGIAISRNSAYMAEIGSRGGKKTVKTYGSEHMAALGRKGIVAMRESMKRAKK